MARDKSDRATRDLLNPNPVGGYRPGAGRPKKAEVKVKIGWSVSSEAKKNIEQLASGKNYSPSELLDYIMKKASTAPAKV
jgi:hypothetical protein